MSKNRKHLMRSSLIMLIVAAVALSSATYAWFTAGTTASVTDIEFSASASSGILVSADAVNWTSSISQSDINTAQAVGEGTSKVVPISGTVVPVSSALDVSDGEMAMFSATGTDTTTATVTEATSGYYKFNLYFKNDGASDVTLQIDESNSTVVAGTTDKGLQNCARIAFIDQGLGTLVDNLQTITNIKAAAAGTSAIMWEPNAKTHGTHARSYRFALNTNGTDITTTQIAADTAYPYVGLKAVGNGTVKNDAIVRASTSDTATALIAAEGTVDEDVCTLEAGKIHKVTVYIWIEGQDVDCNNAESGGAVKTTLKFNAVASTSGGGTN